MLTDERTPAAELAEALHEQLASAFVLYTNYKRYQWECYGPRFRDMHLLFDEHANAVLATIDEIAERLRMVGEHPITDLKVLSSHTDVKSSTALTMKQMVEEGEIAEALVTSESREAIRMADRNGDPSTEDLFTRLLQVHEKYLWILKQVLKQDEQIVGLDNDGFRISETVVVSDKLAEDDQW